MDTRGHHRLEEFLRRSELTGTQLAKLARLAPMQIYHLRARRRKASLEVAVRLEDASCGAIPIRSWVERTASACKTRGP